MPRARQSRRPTPCSATAARPVPPVRPTPSIPFPDAVEVCLAAGVTAFVQPGGSMRDAEVVAAADRVGATMLLTGVRHFRH